ncbi:uncharacterized protein K460DRAFT_349846 [Cucurbitaria berberidis CBS 394.84]|uniref:Uncharacterized protein n=1 Tax=Cucurbitaria berberidis CBS 394.84 TaxID=1168544 RepID=A0A9P4LCG2_9PLEO|nr:uncharacterized protein K460DRAFT_349846 [Cucurbitaria berberidis CBS 394.84]KAF1849683.1 hypothetical protein K460DRAFT_349846 [Cucurbitaria berberidis CBS 394.84]
MSSAYTVITPAPEPTTPKGHISDLDGGILTHIFLIANFGTLMNFAHASPYLTARMGRAVELELSVNSCAMMLHDAECHRVITYVLPESEIPMHWAFAVFRLLWFSENE